MADLTQEQLDLWFFTDPEERAAMASGLLPRRLQAMQGKTAGCVRPIAMVALAGVGAALFSFARGALAIAGTLQWVSPAQAAIAGALVGAALGFYFSRSATSRGVRLAQVTVSAEVLDLRFESAGSGVRFVSSDGRAFRSLAFGDSAAQIGPLQGRYKAYYIDMEQLRPATAGGGAETKTLLALEVV
jgi:hypothetical protein